MDELLRRLLDCSRFLRLEEALSEWESQAAEEKFRIQELQETICRKEAELSEWKDSGFLQNFLGSSRGKKEKLRQITELHAVLKCSVKDLENLERKTEKAKEEWLALAGSREAYLKARRQTQLTSGQESQLILEELAAFGPLALNLAQKSQHSLENVLLLRNGAEDIQHTLLREATQNARDLQNILVLLPEGFADTGDYLQGQEALLRENTSEENQRRLHLAISQLQNLINQLRAMLGE